MMEFQIKRSARKCHETGRELKAGEGFYSQLIRDGADWVRQDFSEEAWSGADESAIGWWRSRIPKSDHDRVYWAPREVLLSYFSDLQETDDDRETAYVMALLLVRKKILQLIDKQQQADREVLELRNPRENQTWMVPVVELTPEQISEIQQELGEQLFTDQPPEA